MLTSRFSFESFISKVHPQLITRYLHPNKVCLNLLLESATMFLGSPKTSFGMLFPERLLI